ncbi:glycoside hydrolase family 78 protein [Amanita thiersii Skay4041]|uniref:Glycoside hydrolase family 78 protein n=1 Tax=Amanita thiersii Skay4041 TaxID=703135 RepID=A0A2A9NJD2_9AGAR|nr:glycoside hydrolase family 78 protein [Amanita thiersii Skay4041]
MLHTTLSPFLFISLLLFPSNVIGRAPSGPWDQFNYAPDSKSVQPVSIHSTHGTVTSSTSHRTLHAGGNAVVGDVTLRGAGSWVALDFGVEVGGLISMTFPSSGAGDPSASLSLSFTESPMFIRPTSSDDSSFPFAGTNYDGVLPLPSPLPNGLWTQPAFSLRGGFRYLTVVLTKGTGPITFGNVTCSISFMPHVQDLRDYNGYFYASDKTFWDPDFLTKVWYAGAYTVQTNTVPLNTGRMVPFAPQGTWANNATLGVAGPIIVDGDMGIAVPTQFVSTFDLLPTRNALSTMFAAINPKTGALPESGPPLSQQGSDTYHAWTLIGTYNYYLFSGDEDWLKQVWSNYTIAVRFLEGKVDSDIGLMDVTGLRDWARLGGGGINAEGNALLFKVLETASELASYLNLTDLSAAYARNASSIKDKFNEVFWVESVGMYRDNATTTMCPQDANSLAVLYNLTGSTEKDKRVSTGLQANWNNLGPVPPELPDTISPFISGFELQAHFIAGNDDVALDLMRRTWGYMLYTELSVQSTLLEGFTGNGSLAYRYYRGYNNDPAYTSHAHGWSSGPTSALTFYVLGLTVTSPEGRTWQVAPHLEGGVDGAEGGFSTGLGWFGAKWVWDGENITVTIEAPSGTTGVAELRGRRWNLAGGVTHTIVG